MFKKLAVGVVALSLGMGVAVARPHHHHHHYAFPALIAGIGLVSSYMAYNSAPRYSYQEEQLKADRERLLLQQYDNQMTRERMEAKRLHLEEMRLDAEIEKMRKKEDDYPKLPF